MEKIALGNSVLQSTRLIYGCMRIVGDQSADSKAKGKKALQAALDAGYNHFDHADIYGGGECETLFGEFLKENPGLRDELIITSKCGVVFKGNPAPSSPGRYDFRKDHILKSVDGTLSRLGIDTLDLLLLHRPDYLFHPDEVADAFAEMTHAGKVRHFGVSNFRPSQLTLLQSSLEQLLLVNQVEINIHNIDTLLDGTLDQCIESGITPQAWCPLGGVVYPAWGNTFTPETEERIKKEFDRQSEIYGVENWIIMLAWILKLPSQVAPIIGSTDPDRIATAKKALEIDYTREDWYRLLEARNGQPVP
ncbi:aldo/keto reductase [Pelagicoccus mobilis]|uniref:Aldo/keto reductase n=1 Tax=Pelagicoccus mobilis TaxID=415221 RepID=A0A934S427_9BACT|nr:aldo/keto reductase [Pelagicoccus mobilis]MBK1879009.1 aldo/keto reductase [Pelagicoccus mobilis]